MIAINQLTLEDVNRLKNIYGTNNTSVSVSTTEIKQIRKDWRYFTLIVRFSGALLNVFA